MLIKVPVHTDDEYATVPDYCEIELSDKQLARIKELAAEVKRLGVYKIVEFDYIDRFLEEDYDSEGGPPVFREPEDFRVECTCINIVDDHIFWDGYIKHTGIVWDTEWVRLDQLVGGCG